MYSFLRQLLAMIMRRARKNICILLMETGSPFHMILLFATNSKSSTVSVQQKNSKLSELTLAAMASLRFSVRNLFLLLRYPHHFPPCAVVRPDGSEISLNGTEEAKNGPPALKKWLAAV